jgi:hypothetical protein
VFIDALVSVQWQTRGAGLRWINDAGCCLRLSQI